MARVQKSPTDLARLVLEKHGVVASPKEQRAVVTPSPEKLSDEQRRQIEHKRREALARREARARQAQMPTHAGGDDAPRLVRHGNSG